MTFCGEIGVVRDASSNPTRDPIELITACFNWTEVRRHREVTSWLINMK